MLSVTTQLYIFSRIRRSLYPTIIATLSISGQYITNNTHRMFRAFLHNRVLWEHKTRKDWILA